MRIRDFKAVDQPGVTSLQHEFIKEFFPEFLGDPREAQWNADIYDIDRYYLQQGGKFWVIEENEEIVGVGGFHLLNPGTAEMKRIRIKACCRGKGFGKNLIRTIENYCRDHAISKIMVDTDERLAIAKNLYEKLGYTVYRTESVVEGDQIYINYYFEKDMQ